MRQERVVGTRGIIRMEAVWIFAFRAVVDWQ
jgi:hypothetical protein